MSKFKVGDRVIWVRESTSVMRKGGVYEVLSVPRTPEGSIEIIEESGERDIYWDRNFELDKNYIISKIIDEL